MSKSEENLIPVCTVHLGTDIVTLRVNKDSVCVSKYQRFNGRYLHDIIVNFNTEGTKYKFTSEGNAMMDKVRVQRIFDRETVSHVVYSF